LIATHDAALLRRFDARVVTLQQGRLAADSKPQGMEYRV
jgi:ABC-type ATPase involved in cell division